MVVNCKKTTVLCVSDALNYSASSFIKDSDDNKFCSGKKMKILGFHMDGRPSCHGHVGALKSRMRETVSVIRHLGWT